MGKKKKQLTQQKEKWFGFTSSYASNILTDTDADNSFEIDNYVYSDSQVVECLDYMVNMTLTNIEFEKEEQKEVFNQYKQQFANFLIQYVVEGFSANVDGITLKNAKIQKKIYDGKSWHILYKTTVYNTFDDKEDLVYCISTKKFVKGTEYDKFIDNKYLTVRKNHIIRMEQLKALVDLKNEVIDVLNIAIKKNAIPTLIMKTDIIDDETKKEMLSFLEGYKNASASIVNSELVGEIITVDAKVNEDLIFNTISLINSEIASLLGVSNSILVSPRSFAYSTTNAIVSIVNRNVNQLRELMEGVINEIAEKNKLDLKVELPKIIIDEYELPNQPNDTQQSNGDK
jgi:hypothetical protein